MTIEVLKEILGWMTLINLVFYIWTAVACAFMKDFLARITGKMFGISPEANKQILYGYVGAYKLLFIVFNLVPWLALCIICR